AVLSLAWNPAAAQSSGTSSPPTRAPNCEAPEHRQFDFWIGEWDVLSPTGAPLGKNTITRILKGCVLQENWTGQGGGSGTSFNKYDPRDRKWHQSWVDDSNGFLLLSGGLDGGAMRFTGEMPSGTGGTIMHRLSFTRVGGSPERVRQFWETSTDNGKTWTVAFDGTYVRRR
ncbi:MAG: hypothetical protein ACREON_18845, partial [Gemmatimonadaceae bacterium]